MCKDPACDKEVKQCETLAKALAEVVPVQVNGRCEYHEELVKGLSSVTGRVDLLLLLSIFIFGLLSFHLFGYGG